MTVLLLRPGSASARPCQGRSSLDRACAPAEYGSSREAQTGKISQSKCPRFQGTPEPTRHPAGLCQVRDEVLAEQFEVTVKVRVRTGLEDHRLREERVVLGVRRRAVVVQHRDDDDPSDIL